jgi:putative colanic acid biosynthesis UDP-glucose lipid carrier transferase
VAAVIESLSNVVAETDVRRRVRFGNIEPAILALLKQLDPVVTVLMLFVCAFALRQQITFIYTGLGLLTYLVAAPIFDRVNVDRSAFKRLSLSKAFSRVLLSWAPVVAVLLFLAFIFKVSDQFSRAVILSWFATTPLALLAVQALRHRTQSLIASGATGSRYVVIGANRMGFELNRRLPAKGFLGFFDFRSADRLSQVVGARSVDGCNLVGHCRDVARFVRAHGVTDVYIALPISNVPRIAEVIQQLRDTTASIYFIPDVFAFDLIQGRLVDIDGVPALSVCDTPFHGMDAVLKRAFDLVVGGLILLAASPLMATIAVCVKATSRGPVLFRQRRYGLNGEEINIFKFRSMTVCEDGDEVKQATRDDSRVTPFGGFLRRTSLDELPQLFNVLQGAMSLVGPRPHAVAHNEQYRTLISGYMIRHKVRPGITGWAQVNGLRGETDTIDKMSARVNYDIDYLKHWSLALDCKILLRTLLIVLKRDANAY